ncbi:hypothetical protein GCM10028777_27080 [Angustibacter speluncae]
MTAVVDLRDRAVTFVTPVRHRAVDLLRVGLEINAVGPEQLEEALAQPGCVVIDALKHDTWSDELQEALRARVADVVLLVAEDVSVDGLGPDEGYPQLQVVTAPVLAGDVAAAVRAIWGEEVSPATGPVALIEPVVAEEAPTTVEPEPVTEPESDVPDDGPRRWFGRRPAKHDPPAAAPVDEDGAPRVVDLVKAEAVVTAPAVVAPAPSPPPLPPPPARQPRAATWEEATHAVLAHLEHAETWTQVAERMVHDAAAWTETDTALLLRDAHGTWVPVAGEGLRQLEYALVLHDLHPAVQMTTPDQPVVVVPDTDLLRGVIAQMPLASRRSLLLARVPGLAALLLAGTSARALGEEDVVRVGQVVTHLTGPLQDALRRRDFADAVQRFL